MKQFVEYTGGPLYYDYHHFDDVKSLWEFYSGPIDPDVIEAELCDQERLGYLETPSSLLQDIVERITDDVEDPEAMTIQGEDELLKALKTFLNDQTQIIYVPNGKFVKLERR